MTTAAPHRAEPTPSRATGPVKSRDRRLMASSTPRCTTTGIYCRPSRPARTPALPQRHLSTPARPRPRPRGSGPAERCLPDATPGSPDWDVSATAAGQAMRLLIADGVVSTAKGQAWPVGSDYTHAYLNRRDLF